MPQLPRISIVIPNLNSGRTLARCIRSLLDQQYPELEVIVADGGSVDESGEILRSYEGRLAKVLRERDSGQADGINRGFRHATGDIFGWLCADDESAAGALHYIGRLFQTNPGAGVLAGACLRVFEGGFQTRNPVRADGWGAIYARNTLDQPSVFWRAEWWRRAGELDTTFDLAFDWEYWCRLRRAGARLMVTARTLSHYHFSATHKTSTGGGRHVDEGSRIVRRYHSRTLAAAYGFVYRHFDLHGALDGGRSATGGRRLAYLVSRRILRSMLGPAMDEYPWHFASLQARAIRWYEEEKGDVPVEDAGGRPPRVTIVTPALNDARRLSVTLQSVLSQSYEDIEYIVVDGGSTDETAAMLEACAGRVTFIAEADRGPSNAVNQGIRAATGEFVAWLHCGEILAAGAVERAVAELAAVREAAAAYGGPSEPVHREKLTALAEFIPAGPVFVRKSVLDEIGYLDEGLRYAAHHDLMIRIAKRYEFAYVPESLGGAGERRSRDGARVRETGRVMARYTGGRLAPGYLISQLELRKSGVADYLIERIRSRAIRGM